MSTTWPLPANYRDIIRLHGAGIVVRVRLSGNRHYVGTVTGLRSAGLRIASHRYDIDVLWSEVVGVKVPE